MGLALTIETSDLTAANKKLRSLGNRIKNIQGAGPGVRLIVQEDVDLRFASAPPTESGGQVLGGEYWSELSESYLARRPDRRNGQIYRDTGELLQSLTAEGSPQNVSEYLPDGFVFGTALPKAAYLQRARPFLFWHPALLEKVADYLVNWVERNS